MLALLLALAPLLIRRVVLVPPLLHGVSAVISVEVHTIGCCRCAPAPAGPQARVWREGRGATGLLQLWLEAANWSSFNSSRGSATEKSDMGQAAGRISNSLGPNTDHRLNDISAKSN